MEKKVRVRFAPSPTGGLHLGGVRTVLYNYLFAKQQQGEFILRIEDTDQNRYVPGAEEYIFECLRWCGLQADESVEKSGVYGPYRQSERKAIYRPYAEELIKSGYAYYAFDSPEELDQMRARYKSDTNPSPQYDVTTRMYMRNSLTLPGDEVKSLLEANTPHVIRIKMPDYEPIVIHDLIRGEIRFDPKVVDDKVLLKADGMPTYHLAVVVDDYLMKITHIFRGEEWLPSSPVHVLLWKYLGWEKDMPQWAHLPLILGPEGKLSKRDGAKFGFPVYAMSWTDPVSGETTEGFREKGFLPEAFINFLALLGWNDGTDQEIFSKEELITHFRLDRVHSGGAKFDYDKAKWFNHEWIKRMPATDLAPDVTEQLAKAGIKIQDEDALLTVIDMVKERCHLLPDFIEQAGFFFVAPIDWDLDAVRPKWDAAKLSFFTAWIAQLESLHQWSAEQIEANFKALAEEQGVKPGQLQLPLRVMLVGGKFGPPVFEIAAFLGREEVKARIERFLHKV